MKTQFQRLSRSVSTLQGVRVGEHAKAWTPYPRAGVALVITLILLSVITFMTVTFLVVSRREGEQVDTTTQQNISKFAAIGIEQQAEGQIAAGIMASRNGYNFGLVVSTNYQSPVYFTGGVLNAVTNVNYYDQNGVFLTGNNYLQMQNNLLYLPRPPVFITTNRNQLTPEFRFFLNLNGNIDQYGSNIFESNGVVINLDTNGNAIPNGSGGFITSVQVGDPEWIGFLEHPDQRHSASNFFLSRGAFIAIPIGNTLDINYIHNQAKFLDNSSLAATAPYEGFLRNEGVGTWEINLAAFLHTLNTNWDWNGFAYSYNNIAGPSATASPGTSFSDAAAIMQYRNSGNYNALSPFMNLYGLNAFNSFLMNAGIDAYSAGPLMTNLNLPGTYVARAYTTSPWNGADNPLQFVRPRDLLNLVPAYNSVNSFTNHLYSVGTNLDTYDRYTFYTMLAQMGIGSAPEPAPYPVGGGSQFTFTTVSSAPLGVLPIGGRNQMSYGSVPEAYPYLHGRKMNLNYNNIGSNGIPLTATNFAPWTPVEFFTNAADRLLRSYYPTNFAIALNGTVVVTNININFIPIYPVNYYTPAVHRLLQLAANMYDASLNKNTNPAPDNFDYPSVFRPYFIKTGSGVNTVVYVNGYTEAAPVGGVLPANCSTTPLDLRRPADLNNVQNFDTVNNIYGIPYVIGARTNLPNFNQFSMATVVQISRKMQFSRTSPTAPVSSYKTNMSYVIGISNILGAQCWNSYTNYWTRPIKVFVTNDFSMLVSNTMNGTPILTNQIFGNQPVLPLQINPWPNGISNGQPVAASFAVPLLTNVIVLPMTSTLQQNGSYTTNGSIFIPLAINPVTRSYYPDWGLNVTNRVRVIIQDSASERILDYVQLGGLGQLTGLDSQDTVISNLYNMNLPPGANLWDTNVISTNNPLPGGLYNQYRISLGAVTVSPIYWSSAPSGSSPASIALAIQGFSNWLTGAVTANQIQLPFSETISYAKVYTWSANDPLVHYTVGDLTDQTKTGGNNIPVPLTLASPTNVLSGLNIKSSRYQPWNTINSSYPQLNANNQLAYRDPMIQKSSDWQFSTNKYPNVGWVGRVHRGTPWQTVYLKSTNGFNLTQWQTWTGNPDPVDAANTMPQNDLRMLDLFTAAPSDNASRGQLSVNQTNAAAWAAVLDGVMVLANNMTPGVLVPTNINTTQPGGPGQTIISFINTQQTNGAFASVGQLLSVPQLTTASPYITMNNNDPNLTDAVYERIPQQIMGLLRVGTPRYAIYSYGQALKPANNSIVQSGSFFGMCTNYQITGEVLTRTIVRFDNMPTLGLGSPAPGTAFSYSLPVVNQLGTYVIVNNTMPPVHAVVESFQVLGPDQ